MVVANYNLFNNYLLRLPRLRQVSVITALLVRTKHCNNDWRYTNRFPIRLDTIVTCVISKVQLRFLRLKIKIYQRATLGLGINLLANARGLIQFAVKTLLRILQ